MRPKAGAEPFTRRSAWIRTLRRSSWVSPPMRAGLPTLGSPPNRPGDVRPASSSPRAPRERGAAERCVPGCRHPLGGIHVARDLLATVPTHAVRADGRRPGDPQRARPAGSRDPAAGAAEGRERPAKSVAELVIGSRSLGAGHWRKPLPLGQSLGRRRPRHLVPPLPRTPLPPDRAHRLRELGRDRPTPGQGRAKGAASVRLCPHLLPGAASPRHPLCSVRPRISIAPPGSGSCRLPTTESPWRQPGHRRPIRCRVTGVVGRGCLHEP